MKYVTDDYQREVRWLGQLWPDGLESVRAPRRGGRLAGGRGGSTEKVAVGNLRRGGIREPLFDL